MTVVLLGNVAPVEPKASVSVNGEKPQEPQERGSLPEQTTVVIDTPDYDVDGKPVPPSKKLAEIRRAFELHSTENPAWVEGHDEDLTRLLTQEFDCELGRPSDWDKPQPQAQDTEEPVNGKD